MKNRFFVVGILTAELVAAVSACVKRSQSDYPVQPVAFNRVRAADSFWKPRIETNRAMTIPYAFKMCEDSGRVENFEIAAGSAQGSFRTTYPFDDSDVYKIIEGASYSLAQRPDPELDKYVDGLIAKLVAAQEKDGYLYTARTIKSDKPVMWVVKDRWVNEREDHELYNAGHLFEAAAAHYQATGKKNLLDVAVKFADLICNTFGPNGRHEVPGHQVIEIGLSKLFRVTGNRLYLATAKFFLDERGNARGHKLYGEYAQDHRSVVEQSEAVGHAVRAAYMYAGMADVAALTGDQNYIRAIDRLWEDVVTRKIYLTGGIGAAGSWEGFGPAYELPNASAYAETCAAIANAFWNQRMFLLHGDAKYVDVLERIIYNGALSGISLGGDRFFYPNPLASFGQHERSPWFTCACCPSNVTRFMPSIPGYAYAVAEGKVYVNLFIQGTADVKTAAGDVRLEQTTNYPWDGNVKIRVVPENPRFSLCVRIPGWARNIPLPGDLYRYTEPAAGKLSVKVNGEEVPLDLDKGYVSIAREWRSGDTVEIVLPMPVRRVTANAAVAADRGRVAVERGPIVYCAEGPDNGGHVGNLVLGDEASLTPEARLGFSNDMTFIAGEVEALRVKGGKIVAEKTRLTLIPYYFWAHRGKSEMAVWLARDRAAARPLPEPTIASTSKASSSGGGKGVDAIRDQFEPENSNDHATPYLHWWPKKGTEEWVQYDFAAPATISETSVYWFDDTGRGECRVPVSWRAFFRAAGKWAPVKNVDPYGVEKDTFDTVRFRPVRADGLRLEITFQEKYSAGIHEWKVR